MVNRPSHGSWISTSYFFKPYRIEFCNIPTQFWHLRVMDFAYIASVHALTGTLVSPTVHGPQPTAVASGKAKESAPVVPPAQQEAVQEEKGAGKKEVAEEVARTVVALLW